MKLYMNVISNTKKNRKFNKYEEKVIEARPSILLVFDVGVLTGRSFALKLIFISFMILLCKLMFMFLSVVQKNIFVLCVLMFHILALMVSLSL